MPLYKVRMSFDVVVEAPSMFAALDVGIEAFRTNKNVPATGAGTLIERHSQIPREWRTRRPANWPTGPLAKGPFTCGQIIPPGRAKKK